MAAKYEERMKAKGFLSCHLDTLPTKFMQIAREELGETDEVRRTALVQFKKRILDDNKLKCPTDDDYLIQFLRARKYDVDKALGLLNNYFNLNASFPELYESLDKEKMDKLTSSNSFNVLPFRDNDGCLILTMKMENWDSDDINVRVLIGTTAAILFCLNIYPVNQICGVRLIYDAKNYSFKQMRCFVPKYLPLVAKALRNSLPIRFKSIHVVNEAIVFQYAWSILKLLLSEKIRSRIYFHGKNTEELQKYIPKEIIPREYGGDLNNYYNHDWLTKELDKFCNRFLMLIKPFF
ncbi:alpha-tocopherol transfer protein-like [Trichonephila clavata]|uniref:Alpha-tocopherol transfer protein-like n=1 Tax=Trichonephila clavata TaxID=2740835 RepID=A0A8X6JF30_TRICU|nr:alpha-tocopherol transfer protein-like [Trichonephila clavata]